MMMVVQGSSPSVFRRQAWDTKSYQGVNLECQTLSGGQFFMLLVRTEGGVEERHGEGIRGRPFLLAKEQFAEGPRRDVS